MIFYKCDFGFPKREYFFVVFLIKVQINSLINIWKNWFNKKKIMSIKNNNKILNKFYK